LRVWHAAAILLLLSFLATSCARSGGGASANGSYHDTAETWAELRALAGQFPGQAQAFSLGRTWEGREIPALTIGETSADDRRVPNIYLVGGMHAREWIGVEVPLRFARYLLERAAQDPAAQRAIRSARFYVVPILNPDGLEYAVHTDRLWYKTRRDNGDGSWGVNLNDNFPLGWNCLDRFNASPSALGSSDVYRGTAPFSEPESQAIRDLMLSHPPAGFIDFHSYGTIIYPSLPRVVSAQDIELWKSVGPEMARLMLSVNGRFYTAAGTDRNFKVGDVPDPSQCGMLGQLFNWARDRFGAAAFLIELPPGTVQEGFSYVAEAEIDGVVAEQAPAILHFTDYVVGQAGR
jgi:carboxypeptidase T